MLKMILAFRSIANHFLEVFQRGDPPEFPSRILRKPKNHFFIVFFWTPALSFQTAKFGSKCDLFRVFFEQVKFCRFRQDFDNNRFQQNDRKRYHFSQEVIAFSITS